MIVQSHYVQYTELEVFLSVRKHRYNSINYIISCKMISDYYKLLATLCEDNGVQKSLLYVQVIILVAGGVSINLYHSWYDLPQVTDIISTLGYRNCSPKLKNSLYKLSFCCWFNIPSYEILKGIMLYYICITVI